MRAAKQLGGRLIVAVNSDASTRTLKGEGRPRVPGDERAEILAALGSPTNRLLEAWVAAHPVKLAAGKCPEDSDP